MNEKKAKKLRRSIMTHDEWIKAKADREYKMDVKVIKRTVEVLGIRRKQRVICQTFRALPDKISQYKEAKKNEML